MPFREIYDIFNLSIHQCKWNGMFENLNGMECNILIFVKIWGKCSLKRRANILFQVFNISNIHLLSLENKNF